jgi:hypothetical protein
MFAGSTTGQLGLTTARRLLLHCSMALVVREDALIVYLHNREARGNDMTSPSSQRRQRDTKIDTKGDAKHARAMIAGSALCAHNTGMQSFSHAYQSFVLLSPSMLHPGVPAWLSRASRSHVTNHTITAFKWDIAQQEVPPSLDILALIVERTHEMEVSHTIVNDKAALRDIPRYTSSIF